MKGAKKKKKKKKKKSLNGFKFGTFIARFPSEGAASVTVKGLKIRPPRLLRFSLSLQLLEFMRQHPDQGSGRRAFQQAVEKTRGNIAWMQQNYDTLSNWLDKLHL